MFSLAENTRYLRRFFTVSLGVLLLAGLFNLVVDPYDKFGVNWLGVYFAASREHHLTQAVNQPHDALLIGNSRVAMIPVSRLGGRRFFNAGMEGGNLPEVELFLEKRLRPGELVLLNLDHHTLGHFADLEPSIAFTPLSPKVLGNYLFSLKSLELSGRTINKWWTGQPPYFYPDGTTRSEMWRRNQDVNDPTWAGQQRNVQRELAALFRFDERRIEDLRRIKTLVESRGGRLAVYFSPLQEDLLSALESGDIGEQWKLAVRKVRELFPGAVDLTHSAYSSRTNYPSTDPAHFYPEVAVEFMTKHVLPQVFGSNPPVVVPAK